MANNIFLNFDKKSGLRSDSAIEPHPGAFEIDSFSGGMSLQIYLENGRMKPFGEPAITPVKVTGRFNAHGPALLTYLAKGLELGKTSLYVSANIGSKPVDLYSIDLENAFLADFSLAAGSQGGGEALSLYGSSIMWNMVPHDKLGTPKGNIAIAYDLETNQETGGVK
jgi:type VI protein secretion system component Hcp